jgi:hypothetical protein
MGAEGRWCGGGADAVGWSPERTSSRYTANFPHHGHSIFLSRLLNHSLSPDPLSLPAMAAGFRAPIYGVPGAGDQGHLFLSS